MAGHLVFHPSSDPSSKMVAAADFPLGDSSSYSSFLVATWPRVPSALQWSGTGSWCCNSEGRGVFLCHTHSAMPPETALSLPSLGL